MSNEQFWTQIVIAIAAIVTTYITTKHGPKITDYFKGSPKEPQTVDRYNTMFNGYEKLINELQEELDQSRKINDKQANIIDKMQDKMNILQDKLHEAQMENRKLVRKINAYGENGI